MSKVVLCAAVLAVAVVCRPALGNAETAALARMDFRQIVKESKDKVFPALVFIRVLRESHESGKLSSESARLIVSDLCCVGR